MNGTLLLVRILVMTDLPTDAEIDKHIDKYMTLMEADLGQDIIPIVIILMCRVAVKYNIDINWLVSTILMGYHNELPPDLDTNGVTKFDS